MNNVPEIRYDAMTDSALLDPESAYALRGLAAGWVRRAASVHPIAARAKRRSANLQRAWRAMAAARASEAPFLLIRRSSGCTTYGITPSACITVH
jgi:hypothetical protein